MAITADAGGLAPAAEISTRGGPAAWTVFGGAMISMIGLTWDVQWHTEVGPDTFFTLPHLFLYSGSAVSGIASLIVVLAATAAQRARRPFDTRIGGRPVAVFGGIFAAPLGYLVSGVGAASFLLYGMFDLWWHSLYGFDAVIDSPPHIGLLLSISITILGSVLVFAAARDQGWGRFGALFAVGLLITFSSLTVAGLQGLRGIVDAPVVGMAFFTMVLVLLARALTGRPGGALVTGVAVAGLQAVFWWFSPWAARSYAAAVGLPLRDHAMDVPQMPVQIPMILLLVAAGLELVLRRKEPTGRWLVPVLGAVGAALIAATLPLQKMLAFGMTPQVGPHQLPTIVVGALFGLLAGFLGWRFGRMTRLLAPEVTR